MSFDPAVSSDHPAAAFVPARDRVPKGGVPAPAIVTADKKIACIDKYAAVDRECRTHMKMAIGVPRDTHAAAYCVDEVEWRELFQAHATAMDKCNGMSITVMGFMALCAEQWCADPTIEEEYPTLESCMNEAYVRWALMSTRHTLSARHDWPMRQEWVRFRRMVTASIVHGWFKIGGGEALRLKLEGAGECVQGIATEKRSLAPSIFPPTNPPALDGLWQDRREPHALRVELDEEEKRARAAIAAGKKDVKIGISAEASGTIWREQPEERVTHFPFQMARLIARVEAEEALLAEFDPHNAYARMRFSDLTYAKVHAWLREKLIMEQPDATTGKFRELATRMCLPIGTDDEKFRKRETISDKKTAIDLLSNEIGANMAQFINNRLLRDMRLLLNEALDAPTDDTVGALAFDAILLTLLDMECIQKLRFKFAEQYVLLDPLGPAALQRMRNPRYMNQARKCPVIVFLCATYWLLYKQRLLSCGPMFVDALLGWLIVMRRDFTRERRGPSAHMPLTPQQMRDPVYTPKIMTEQDDNVSLLVGHFLNPDSLLLHHAPRGPDEEEAREGGLFPRRPPTPQAQDAHLD